VKDGTDVDALRGRADIVVIGSQTIPVMDRGGPEAVGPFIAGLRPA